MMTCLVSACRWKRITSVVSHNGNCDRSPFDRQFKIRGQNEHIFSHVTTIDLFAQVIVVDSLQQSSSQFDTMREYFNQFHANAMFVRPAGQRWPTVYPNMIIPPSSSAQMPHLSHSFAHQSIPVHYSNVPTRVLSCPQMPSPHTLPHPQCRLRAELTAREAQSDATPNKSGSNQIALSGADESSPSTNLARDPLQSIAAHQSSLPVQPISVQNSSNSAFRKPSDVRMLSRNSNGTSEQFIQSQELFKVLACFVQSSQIT
jgi:hypothetical protein